MATFRFGRFELDIDRFELRHGGDVIRAEPRVLELLHYLIRNRERVVPKEELLDNLWRDTHVSDSALTSTVRDARRVLSDSPTSPRWIKTVYGRGFRFVGEAAAASDTPAPAPATASTRKSIAVLPFMDLSPNHDQGYFCDGIAEELINSLTRIEELRVVSRAVAFDFRNDDDVRALGEKLGVDHILRGSVRKAEDRLRITVHLVDVRSGHHVWSEKYDRMFDREGGDIFALQDEIAENTVRALLGVLTERNRKAVKSTPVRLDVYEFYLKGRTYLSQSALEQAVEMFEIAIEFDPGYAPAYAGLADAMAEQYLAKPYELLRRRASNASRQAVQLAPDLAETHVCRANVLALGKHYREAAAELEVAMSINPRSFDAHYRYGRMRQQQGKLIDAARLLELAWEIQPADYQSPAALADLYRALGREEAAQQTAARARELCEQHLERRPGDVRAREWLAGIQPSG